MEKKHHEESAETKNGPSVLPGLDVTQLFQSVIGQLPHISVLILVLTAIFNIGYFSQIGVHFIGTMDFTNFVYPFALIFSVFIFLLIPIVWLLVAFLEATARPAEARPKFRKWILRATIIIPAFFYGALLLIPTRYVPEIINLNNPFGHATLMSLCALLWLITAYLRIKTSDMDLLIVGGVLFAVFFATFLWGKAIAYAQVFSKDHYTLTTHRSVINGVALIRTSTGGVLVAVDGKIMFFPLSEIRNIEAETKIEPESFFK
jgi:hypothetical protein